MDDWTMMLGAMFASSGGIEWLSGPSLGCRVDSDKIVKQD